MFYSHEVLTDRKYGLAVVWLSATLGTKSSHRRVSRKQILDVDVAKACETIITPDAPLALRLQSNLLYGLTSVYARQCGYVLHDAEVARNNMRTITNLLHQAALEPAGVHKASTQQLNLQDDPSFDLDLLPLNLDDLNGDHRLEDETQSMLSPHNSQLTIGSQQTIGGLIMPSESSLLAKPLSGIDLLGARASAGRGASVQPPQLFEDDLGLSFEVDGPMALDDAPLLMATNPSRPVDHITYAGGEPRGNSQSNSEAMLQQIQDNGYVDLLGDDMLGNGESNGAQQESPTQEVVANFPTKPRGKKTLPLDHTTSLHNSDLTRWSNNYVERMSEESREMQGKRLAALAKQNAEYWFKGAGMLLGQGMRGPLDLFSAANLLKAFSGMSILNRGQKRTRQDDGNEDGAAKRPRVGQASDEMVTGLQSYDDLAAMNDDTIEQGREAPTPLDDRHLSSVFPWNQSAGSRRPTDAHHTSVSFGGGPIASLHSRRGSRLTSASPLVGRGQTVAEADDGFQLPVSEYSLGGVTGEQEFELYGPAAEVDTQTAVHTQWQRTALGTESVNFLSFLQTAIAEADLARQNAAPGDEEDDELDGSVDFERILPPERNSQIVAAQALMHILSLGSKGLITVTQKDNFAPINMRLAVA